MSSITAWLLDTLIATTLLMAAVMLIRGPARRLFGPQVAYALWALPLLRFFTPALPALHGAVPPLARVSDVVTVLIVEPTDAVPVAAWPLAAVAGGIWLGGVATFLAWQLIGHVRFCRRILDGAETIERIGGVRIVASDAAPGPLAFGLWRRTIAVPRNFTARFDRGEQALAIAHELGHHARGDLYANWAALAVLALHWFDPLAWFAFRAFRADQELANDARVLAGSAAAARHVYARAIVKAAHGGALSPACHFGSLTNLKRRLTMLTKSPASRRRLYSGTGAVVLMITAGLGVTASGSGAHAIDQQPPAVPPASPPTAPAVVKGKHIVVVRDGTATTYDGAAADAFIADNHVPVLPAAPAGGPTEARTVLVGPDAKGSRTLMIKRVGIPGKAGDPILPADFTLPEGCSPDSKAAPQAFVIRGKGDVAPTTYTISCTRKGRESTSVERGAYEEALEGLLTARRQIAAQVTPAFPEVERRRALAAVDTSIAEIEADLAAAK